MEVTTNAYGDLQIAGRLPTTQSAFATAVRRYTDSAKRGVWLLLPLDEEHKGLVETAFDLGFRAHHFYKGTLTMQLWKANFPNPTPVYGHHAMGAAGLVVNKHGQILGIHEKFDRSGLWHTSGGHVDEGEDLVTAAVREVQEETGVKAYPLGILTFYELQLPVQPPAQHAVTADDRAKMEQSIRFGTAHFAAFVLCYAPDDTINFDVEEIAEAKWVDVAEFEAHAHDHESVMARYLRCSGKLEKVARLAAARGSFDKTTGADVEVAYKLEKEIRSDLMQGYCVSAKHKRYDTTFDAVYYNSLISSQFVSATAASKQTTAVSAIGYPTRADFTPSTSSLLWTVAGISVAFVAGYVVGAVRAARGR